MTAPDPRPGDSPHGPDADTLARDLTYAVVRHYGYTDDDIAAAEAVHPGTVCGDDCHTEDGGTLHSAAWVELSQTAPVMVDVVAPHVKRILADAVAAAGQERDRLKRGGAELSKSLHFWMELARKVTDSDDLIGDDGDGDWGGVAERLAEMGEAHKRQIARAEAAERRLAEVEGAETFGWTGGGAQ